MKSKHLHLLLFNILFTFSQLCFSSNPDSLSVFDQKTYTNEPKIGWEIAWNFGVYKSNNYSAGFYNGNQNNVNSIDYVFSNYYWRQDIKDQLITNVQRDSFLISDLPSSMSYDMAMHVGFSGRYNYSNEVCLNFSFNFSKLQTKDVFNLQVFPAFSGMVESFVYGGIYGFENRTNIDVGAMYTFNPSKSITPFAEMGLNINNSMVKKNFITIFDKEYNLINIYGSSSYIPNSQLSQYDIRQGGIGFGTYMSGGIRYVLNKQFSLELAATAYLKTINLEGYNKRLLIHESILFRLVMSPFFNLSESEEYIEY